MKNNVFVFGEKYSKQICVHTLDELYSSSDLKQINQDSMTANRWVYFLYSIFVSDQDERLQFA